MFVIETASRACKITILIKRSKVRKVNQAFLPEGIQIEGLLPCLVSQLALLAEQGQVLILAQIFLGPHSVVVFFI